MSQSIRRLAQRALVYLLVQTIPQGQITTYGYIAKTLGIHPRAVAAALRSNRAYATIPCHRVIAAGGRLGGYNRGPAQKVALLAQEGWRFKCRRGQVRICSVH